jgi:hypothetical protein
MNLTRRLIRKFGVAQPQSSARALWRESDLDQRRARRNGVVIKPSPGHHDPVRRIDLAVFPERDVHAVGVDAKPAARAGVEFSTDSHPLRELRGVDEVGENCRGRGGYQLLDLDRLTL